MKCAACGLPIRRGERFKVAPESREGAVHKVCPALHVAAEGERFDEPLPDLGLTLRPGPPEAS